MESKQRNYRKVKQGIVASNKMDKTVVVKVSTRVAHPVYGKIVTRWKKYYAHTDNPDLAIGDKVTIRETRPLSKLKRWVVVTN